MKRVMMGVGRKLAAVMCAAGLGVGPLAAVGAAGVTLVAATSTQATAQTASSIVVQGNRRVDPDTVRSYFQGGPLDAARVDEGVKALFATGLFEDVRVSRAGGRLVVTVVENPVINRVAFEGNRKVTDDQLTTEVQSKPRGTLQRGTVQADVQRIVDVYRRAGRFDVQVVPKTIELPNGRVDLVFEVNEGDRAKILAINFVGNNAFSGLRLRDQLNTAESAWWRFLSSRDVYDPDRLEADKELLRRFYLRYGYADFRVVATNVEFDRARNGFVITLTLEEGEQYRFGTIEVLSNLRDTSPDQLRRSVRTTQGSVYNAELVEKSVEDLTIELSKRGFAFAQVRPRGARDFDTKTIAVTYVVEEGSRVYVERINIRGNTRTRDYVIRREFDLAEGDAYNRVLIDRAERRLKNLGYFKTVRITNEPGSAPDRVIVNVDVEDQATGEFSIAGGYSTSDGFIGEISVGEKNLLGRGHYVKVAASWGERARGFDASFTEPFFLGYRVSAGIDGFAKITEDSSYSSYRSEVQGGAVRFGIPIVEEFGIQVRYTAFNRELSVPDSFIDGDLSNGEASRAVREAIGRTFTSQIGYSLVYNTLDNTQNPTSGLFAEFRQDIAGLGGDVSFVRSTIEARYYYDLGSDMVFLLRGQAGHVAGWGSNDLRIIDQFFKGPDIVRGFAPSGIGPRDLGTRNRDPLGGTLYWGTSAEIQFPFFGVPREFGLRAAVFADAGALWGYDGRRDFGGAALDCNGNGVIDANETRDICLVDSSAVRSSVGVGLIWSSPLGPLRFDYSFVINRERGDREQAFRFSGGARF